jgi:catechol 2,3-dioxygenase-like lactoylglutathione lyase family enzyme
VFDHVTIRASDREASERFYDTVLATIGIEKDHSGELGPEWGDFSMSQADADNPVTRGLHIGFVAPSREAVEEFWRAGTAAGYRDDGAPGPRPEYGDDYFGSFLLDPDGNSAEAVRHDSLRQGGAIDHVWLRVADVAASKRFYDTIAPFASFRPGTDRPERASFRGQSGTFSVVAGPPTEALHMAFGAADDATVEAFHTAATEAGYRDNGGPGERPLYHAGYYAAFVLDPDGNNIEVVNHNLG